MEDEYMDYSEYETSGSEYETSEEEHGYGGWIGGLLIGISIGLFLIGSPKYDGENAEYWFNQYDYEATDNQNLLDCLNEIENEASYYSYGESYEDMQYALDEIESLASDCY